MKHYLTFQYAWFSFLIPHSLSAESLPFGCYVTTEFLVFATERCQSYIIDRSSASSMPKSIEATACSIETVDPENKIVFIYTSHQNWPVWLCRDKKTWENSQQSEAPILTITVADAQTDAQSNEIPAVFGSNYGSDFFDDRRAKKPGMPGVVPILLETVSTGLLPAGVVSFAFDLILPESSISSPVVFQQGVMSDDSDILVVISGTRQWIYRRSYQLGNWYLADQVVSKTSPPTEKQFDDFIAEDKLARALVGVFGWAGKDRVPIYQLPLGKNEASNWAHGDGSKSASGLRSGTKKSKSSSSMSGDKATFSAGAGESEDPRKPRDSEPEDKDQNLTDAEIFHLFLKTIRLGDENEFGRLLKIYKGFNLNSLLFRTTLLHESVKRKRGNIVKLILENGGDINIIDDCGRIPLHWASMDSNIEIVEILLSNNSQINAYDEDRNTPLHIAVDTFNFDTAEILVNHRADINAINSKGQTALHLAVARAGLAPEKNHEIIDSLICSVDVCNFDVTDTEGYTPLLLAAERGNTKAVRMLHDRGADINIENKANQSALFLAITYGHTDTALFLIELPGIDLNQISDNGGLASLTPLQLAIIQKQNIIVKKMIENGVEVNVNSNSEDPAFYLAVSNSNVEIIEMMVRRHPQTIHPDHSGNSPLHRAVRRGNFDIVKIILNMPSIDVNETDRDGNSALHIAATKDLGLIVHTLLNHGASIDVVNEYSQTALHLAVLNSCFDVIKILVDGGANLSITDNYHNTALALADKNMPKAIVKLMKKASKKTKHF